MDNQYLAYLRTERNQFTCKLAERFTLSAEQKVILENFVIAFDSVMHKYIEQKELADLAQKVSDMRAAQSTYFASRTQTNLDLSKQKERNFEAWKFTE